jgi:hypothetical protein
MGEYAQDAGGPYRETYDIFMEELQSKCLRLLKPSPNTKHAIGRDRDKWILNSSATSPLELEQYAFLGKLMGIAIRSTGFLNLSLSKFIWKLICGELPSLLDLEDIDEGLTRSILHSFRHIDDPSKVDNPITDSQTFSSIFFETFTIINSNDVEIELVPQGSTIDVTFENRIVYCDMVQYYRLHEFDRQARAIREGLTTVIPLAYVNLQSAWDLEILVCGTPEIDIELLERVTQYEGGCNRNSPHVKFFWNVMRSYNTDERQALVKFVWGRTRLPLNEASFTQKFKIQSYSCPVPDQYFPLAHTCFFSLELPAYSSEAILREKLTWAIFNATEMDLDANEIGAAAVAMGFDI